MIINQVYRRSSVRVADNAPEATLRRLPKEHCTGNAGE
jgi:hypothetical protein